MGLFAAMGKTRRRLGVLGGMGPAATALFYRELVAHTCAERDQDHIDAVVLSHASLPDRTHPDARDGDLLELLMLDVALLESAGAECIAIPCNTAHLCHDRLSRARSVPILNMVEEVVGLALGRCPDARAVGVLCTDGTLRDGMYTRACLRRGVEAVYPRRRRARPRSWSSSTGTSSGESRAAGDFSRRRTAASSSQGPTS